MHLVKDNLVSPDADFSELFPEVKPASHGIARQDEAPCFADGFQILHLLDEWVEGLQAPWVGLVSELYEKLCKDERVPLLAIKIKRAGSPIALGHAIEFLIEEGKHDIRKRQMKQGQILIILPADISAAFSA